jgi:diguanylate cyclase (GGDEF)-like protein/PAS domain S-box-containing protein
MRPFRTALGTLYCLMFAVVAHVVLAGASARVGVWQADRMQVSNVANDRVELENLIHDAAAHRPLAEFDRLTQRMNSDVERVLRDEDPAGKQAIRATFARYIDGRVKAGSEMRTNGYRPVALNASDLRQLDLGLHRLGSRFSGQAAMWLGLRDMIGFSTLLGAALLVAIMTGQYQRQAFRSASEELTRRAAEAGERRFRALIQNNSDVIVVTTAEGKIRLASDACMTAWGKTPEQISGKSIFCLIDPERAPAIAHQVGDLNLPGAFSDSITLRMGEGKDAHRDYEARIVNLMEDPDIAGFLWTFHEVTERKRFEAELTRRAFHDGLTGLPNRALFLDHLTHRIETRAKPKDGFAVLFVDLDNFKVVNDSLGHAAGDQLIVAISDRLQSVVRPGDTVARLGGDEFTLLLGEAPTSNAAAAVAQRILDVLAEPVVVAGRSFHVGASIGIAWSQDSGFDAGAMLRDADTAMYCAKLRGKNGISLYTSAMRADVMNRLDIESDLRGAIAGGQLFLQYQPIFELASGRIVETEALVRWNHPTRSVIQPLDFIPIAEETGMICALGDWALREACAQLNRWRGEPQACRLRIYVNASARQLEDPGYVSRVRKILLDSAVDPSLIGIEITETSTLQDLKRVRGVFQELRSLGVRLVVDDFGTGYSSMSYVGELKVDMLKIDRSFIAALSQPGANRVVVQAIISLARNLGLEVTTEGIETEAQFQTLRDMGCDKGQGFFVSKAVDPDAIVSLVSMSEHIRASIPPPSMTRVTPFAA